jgi:hypothetical protein
MRAMQKAIAMMFASAVVAATMVSSNALAFSGAGVGGGGGGHGGVGGFGGFSGNVSPGAAGIAPNNMMFQNLPGPQQRFRQLKLAGQIPTDPAKAAAGAKIVRLSVNGEIVPMALDTETSSGELQFDPNSDYARQLYQAILERPVTVVGDERMRSQIIEAASDQTNTRIVKIDGFVFDRLSPYMVINHVQDAN